LEREQDQSCLIFPYWNRTNDAAPVLAPAPIPYLLAYKVKKSKIVISIFYFLLSRIGQRIGVGAQTGAA
jgi:hypothetical protein